MCLGVYLGCHDLLNVDTPSENSLGIELASWNPPPIVHFPFSYYLGRKGKGDTLECSCLLAQHVDWDETGPTVSLDSLYPRTGPCPFDTLKSYVLLAMGSRQPVTLVCDDSGGCVQESANEDYDHLVISAEMISSDNYLFADAAAPFPWRAFHLTVNE